MLFLNFSLLVFLIAAPIFGIIIAGFLFIINKETKGILYSLVLGLLFGLLAYYFIPLPGYDLLRDHMIIKNIMNNLDFNYVMNIYHSTEIELNRLIISYLVAQTGNVDLLQFFIVFSGYAIIFYMLYDYRKMKNIDNITFLIIVAYVVFGFYTKYFFSGLFNLYAIILFAFAIYLKEIKKAPPVLYIIVLVISILFHNSMYFSLFYLILLYLYRGSLNKKGALTAILITALPGVMFKALGFLDFKVINDLSNLYFSYIQENAAKKVFYDGMLLIIELCKFFFVLLILIFIKKDRNNKIYNYIILLSLGLIPMLFQSRVMIRFVNLISFLGIIPMIDYYCKDNKSKNKKSMFILLIGLTVLYGAYFFRTLSFMDFGNLFSGKLFSNIFDIFNKYIY